MLLDDFMPRYDVHEIHHRVLDTDRETAFSATRRLDWADAPATRLLFWLRSLPEIRRGTSAMRSAVAGRRMTLADMEKMGFIPLAEAPGEEFVYGICGRPADLGSRPLSPGEFASFREPGHTKVAFNVSLRPYGDGRTLVSTETRVISTDAATRRRFRLYWLVVGPFSAFIRREALRTLSKSVRGVWQGGP